MKLADGQQNGRSSICTPLFYPFYLVYLLTCKSIEAGLDIQRKLMSTNEIRFVVYT